MKNSFVPENIEGKQNDITASRSFETISEAKRSFDRACKRLLNPSIWHDLAGDFSAVFMLVNAEGRELHRLAEVGDYFKVDIPGPSTKAGEDYDWVQVEAIENHCEEDISEPYLALRIRPSSNPQKQQAGTAHFFDASSSSSFIISINGDKVTASYHGRNEMINTDTENFSDKVRNTIVATGAFAGLSEMQWTALIKAFLQPEIGA